MKPYILAGVQDGELAPVKDAVRAQLIASGFELAGEYAPAGEEGLWVFCVTKADLKSAIAQAGGLRGFAAVLRVGLCQTEAGVEVSYTDPLYWGNAYWGKDFDDVQMVYTALSENFKTALAKLTTPRFESFGSEKGISAKKLQRYHYMMSMPYFDDVVELDKGSNFAEVLEGIRSRAAESVDVDVVYELVFPDEKMALIGTALTGESGESLFLPKIDIGTPRHVPFLPYELLVLGDRVVSLHGKYRIALSFPDLTMGTFMKIVSTPGEIARLQESLVSD